MTEPLIHELVERQAARKPSAVALIHGDESSDGRVTYGELNQRTNQLAHRLRRLGIGPEVIVGVCLERSIDAAVALLGILKAGGAYVYLDPALPQRRLEGLRTDSQPRVIVTNQEFQSRAGDESDCLDICSSDLSSESSANIPSSVTLDSAAYVLYTSGSTGKPKGALEIHRCLIARLCPGVLPDIQETDICCLNSSLGFGITASRLFLPLALGAPVVICRDDDVKDAHGFLRILDLHRISSAFLAPVLLRTILRLDQSILKRLTHLRAVTVTGSALTPELISSFFKAFPNALLVNVYGSTEIGTTATLQVLDRVAEPGVISIGKPVSNTKVYLLDEERVPVPAETAGEIYVSAPHIAREYLNQPELTAERFLPNPFAPGERLYRTGDLGRLLPNGEILLLGRRDHQVKVRGFRIELREIEMVLEEHESIIEAVVAAQPDPEAENRLIAYFVASAARVQGSDLRTFLSGRLPKHMIPLAFVRLTQMPRTHSGKVDRPALPAYDWARPDLESPYEAPRNSMELELAEIWSEVLKVQTVGIHDNFLELGGDSLAAAQVIGRIRDRFEVDLTLEFLFDQTIADITLQHHRKAQ